jgi:hypothetical protein
MKRKFVLTISRSVLLWVKAISAWLEARKTPMNTKCREAGLILGHGIRLVPLSKDAATIISSAGIHDATFDKMRLNSWTERNQGGGFGIVPHYSKKLAIYVRQSLANAEGFSLGKAIADSPAIEFSEAVEDGEAATIGRVYILNLLLGSRKVGVIGGSFAPGTVNSGAEILDPFKPIPIPEWEFWRAINGLQRTIFVRWASANK